MKLDNHSVRMSRVKQNNTDIELSFRRKLYREGIRGYRVNSKLTGKPDLYFSKRKIVVFLDGCFWHKCPLLHKAPKKPNEFWDKKRNYNEHRDRVITSLLEKKGYKVFRFWEHELNTDILSCIQRLKQSLI